MKAVRVALAWCPCAISAVTAAPLAGAQDTQRFRTDKVEVVVETVARGLQNPWSLAFLPDGRMLVTERPGRLRIVDADGQLSKPLGGLSRQYRGPRSGRASRRGAQSRLRAEPPRLPELRRRSGRRPRRHERGRAVASTRTGRRSKTSGHLPPGAAHTGNNHFGSRLVFDRDGNLFVTLGERFDLRDQAQNPANHLGKLVASSRTAARARQPVPEPGGHAPEIWSIGHRNVQGAALNPATGELWTAEHGARGGDEVNIPQKGKNYGWPVISYGVDYSGAKIGEGTAKPGLEQPVYYWDPSIAPSGMAFYTGDKFPGLARQHSRRRARGQARRRAWRPTATR